MRGVFVLAALALFVTTSLAVNVTYDHRAVVIDGKRRLLVSGSIHYPRSTPQMWPELIRKSKEGGLDVIETYVFWNIHEPTRGQYDFEGNRDLVRFIKTVAEAGLYVHLRIGPYVCAEWNYGGFPVWLHFVPGVEFRTDNEPYKAEMKRFTGKIVDMMKQEKLYASQGGPIILSQIENEYGNIAEPYGASGKSYIKWSAGMALATDTGVPWVMCQQEDAPDPIINTCNGFYCDQFTPNSNNKPKMWTENWTGWFLPFGGAVPYRPTEDVAFAVARFYQRGGTFQNYYMYHGGTNFGRTTGGPFISTSYDYDAPLDEYGIPSQPKWGHLRDLHKVLKQAEEALVATDPTYASPGKNLETAVYRTGSKCAAFLANLDTRSDATVTFNGNSYEVPAWSVSILPDCKTVAYNSAKINALTTKPSFARQSLKNEIDTESLPSSWSWISEPVGISKDDAFTKPGLLEQINTTADKSDYLWYSLSVDIKGNEAFLDGSKTDLHVQSLGHAVHAFVNNKLAGSGRGNNSDDFKVTLDIPVTLVPGKNTIDLLSLTVGLQNYGSFFDKRGAGITGPVKLKSSMGGAALDLSSQKWTYQIGLKGEDLKLGTGDSPLWNSDSEVPKRQPLTWYKTTFNSPSGSNPVAIDFTGMGKGEAWVNGHSIGRFWPTAIAPNEGCTETCNYRGHFSATKCHRGCGKPSQSLYHVPREWLQSSGNTLVLFEEVGGDPTQLTFATRNAESLCVHISESNVPPMMDMLTSDSKSRRNSKPVLSLSCTFANQTITSVEFASFGNPHGVCGKYFHGNCSSVNALSVVQKACVGSNSCDVAVSTKLFGDPCSKVTKSLAVEASCT